MSSYADSCCICFRRVLCASETLASWPTVDAPHACRFVFTCSGRDQIHQPNKTPPPMTPPIFGAAPSVMAQWRSSKGLRLPKCDFVLHRWSWPLHENSLSNSNPSRAPARSVPVCFAANEILYFNFSAHSLGHRFALLPTLRRVGLSSALRSTARQQLKTALSLHSISIGPASVATTGGLVQTALSNARKAPRPISHFCENAPPIEH